MPSANEVPFNYHYLKPSQSCADPLPEFNPLSRGYFLLNKRFFKSQKKRFFA
jgi:hypothetical protein